MHAGGQSGKSWTRYLILVGAGFLAVLVWHFGWRDILAAFARVRPWPFVAMLGVLLAGFWIRAWKWRYVLGPGQNAVGLFFLAKTAGSFSPGRVGELAPLLLKRHRNSRVAAWILVDRVLEVVLTLAFGLAGVWALGLTPWNVAAGMTALAGVCGCAGLYLVYRVDLLKPLEARWPEGSRRQRSIALLASLHEEARELGVKAPLILLITALGKVLDVYVGVFLCVAFGYDVSFLLMCAARAAHALVSAIPVTPDATGVPFAAAAVLLHNVAGMPYEVLTAALALEVLIINVTLWLSFLATSPGLIRHSSS